LLLPTTDSTQVVQPPHGIVLVAAKTYYFGVGGGIKAFKSAVKRDGIFEIKRVYRTAADVSAVLAGRPPVQAGEEVTSAAQTPSNPTEAGAAVQGTGTGGITQAGEAASGSANTAGDVTQAPQAKEGAAAVGSAAAAGAAAASSHKEADGQGGNVREILELSFPLSIQPYFL
jgi:hypothetical protein